MNSLGAFHISIPDRLSEPTIPVTLYNVDDIICNRYRVLEMRKGIPGHGTVFFCLDIVERSPCVLKEIPAEYSTEARRFATIPFHQNVVKLRRLEVVGGSIMMVQDWLPDNLSNHMHEEITGEQIKKIVMSICLGLRHCIRFLSPENKTFIHGDIKPENIFIATDGTYKLADFGEGYTPGYASQEQMNHGYVDYRTDICSIGHIIEELCEICSDINVRNELKRVAKRCTCPNPNDRYQSIQDIICIVSKNEDEPEKPYHLTISQLYNLVLIGEPVRQEMMPVLQEELTTEEICDLAAIYLLQGQPYRAIDTYNAALPFLKRHLAYAGLAKAYLSVSNWYGAIEAATEALGYFPTDYQSIYIYIQALYNLTVEHINTLSPDSFPGKKGNHKSFIDFAPNDQQVREGFSTIISALKALHDKFPTHHEPLRLLGYTYNILGDRDNEIKWYLEYLSAVRDDYESEYYCALALYLNNDTTTAMKHFRHVANFIENSESTSLGRYVMLLYCHYFLGHKEQFINTIKHVEAVVEKIPEKKRKKYENYILKDLLIADCFMRDEEEVILYNLALSDIMYKIRNEGGENEKWCREQLQRLKGKREEWNNLMFSDISASIRQLNLLSYDYESYLCEKIGDYEGVLAACEGRLGYDCTCSDALYNKAVALCRLERYTESIPYYQMALKNQRDEERKRLIEQEGRNVLLYIYNNPDTFYKALLDKASGWADKNESELSSIVRDFGIMFSDNIVMWLSDYAVSLFKEEGHFKNTFDRFVPLINLLSTFHLFQHSINAINEPFDFEYKLSSNLSIFYHINQINLSDAALKILDLLIASAEKIEIPFLLFNCLQLRGVIQYEYNGGKKDEAIDLALADFVRSLELPEASMKGASPYIARAAHYLGKIFTWKMPGEEYSAKAHYYLNYAFKFYSNNDDYKNGSKVALTQSICSYKENDMAKAYHLAIEALNGISYSDDKNTFAAAKYILGLGSYALVQKGCNHLREIMDEGIDAFENALLVFDESTAEWVISIKCLISLYKAREECFHDGSWAMEQYYRKVISDAKTDYTEIKDFLGQNTTFYEE